jgi:hypothetical protein
MSYSFRLRQKRGGTKGKKPIIKCKMKGTEEDFTSKVVISPLKKCKIIADNGKELNDQRICIGINEKV